MKKQKKKKKSSKQRQKRWLLIASNVSNHDWCEGRWIENLERRPQMKDRDVERTQLDLQPIYNRTVTSSPELRYVSCFIPLSRFKTPHFTAAAKWLSGDVSLSHHLVHSHEPGLLAQRTHVLPGDRLHEQQQAGHAGHVAHCWLLPRHLYWCLLRFNSRKPSNQWALMENWLLAIDFTKQNPLWSSRVVHLAPAGVGRCRRRRDDAQRRHVETDGLAQVSRNCSLTQIICNILQQGEVLLIWGNKKEISVSPTELSGNVYIFGFLLPLTVGAVGGLLDWRFLDLNLHLQARGSLPAASTSILPDDLGDSNHIWGNFEERSEVLHQVVSEELVLRHGG